MPTCDVGPNRAALRKKPWLIGTQSAAVMRSKQAIFPDHPEQDTSAQDPWQQTEARHAESDRRNKRHRQLRDGDLGSRGGRRSEHNHQRYIDIGAKIRNVCDPISLTIWHKQSLTASVLPRSFSRLPVSRHFLPHACHDLAFVLDRPSLRPDTISIQQFILGQRQGSAGIPH